MHQHDNLGKSIHYLRNSNNRNNFRLIVTDTQAHVVLINLYKKLHDIKCPFYVYKDNLLKIPNQ